MTDMSVYMSLYDSDSSGADATQTHPDHTPTAATRMQVDIAVAGRMAAPAGSGSEVPAGMQAGAASGGPCLAGSLPNAAMQQAEVRETAQAVLPLAVSALPRSLPALALGMDWGSAGRPRDCRLGLPAPLPAIMTRGVDMDTDALGASMAMSKY